MASTKKRKIDEQNESEEPSKYYEDFKVMVQTMDVATVDQYFELLKTRKDALEQARENDQIMKEIKEHGFAVRIEDRGRYDIKDVHCFRFPYHVRISSVDRTRKYDHAESAKVDESADKQPKWVEATGFNLLTTSKWDREHLSEDMGFDDITEEWDCGDHDSPIRGLGCIDCSFYFVSSFPDKTLAFDLLDDDGEITHFGAGEFDESEDMWKTNVRYVMYKVNN